MKVKQVTVKQLKSQQNITVNYWRAGIKSVRDAYPSVEAILADFSKRISDLIAAEEKARNAKAGIGVESQPPSAPEFNPPEPVAPIAATSVNSAELKIELRDWQKDVADKVIHNLWTLGLPSQMVLQATGTGKTYVLGYILKWAVENGKLAESISPFPILYVTKASVCQQTIDVFKHLFGLDIINTVIVTNYDQLRSKFGKDMITEEWVVTGFGEEHLVYKWRRFMNPAMVVWDECHSLKNQDSTQSKLGQALNELDAKACKQIFVSATPFARVSDTKCFTCACRAVMY